MSVRIIQLLSAGSTVSVGQYDGAFFEEGPAGHNFDWDGEGRIYLSRVANSVAKVNTGTGTAILYTGNNKSYSWKGRCGIYDVTHLWKNNGGPNYYVNLQRFAFPGEELVRQDVFLIISVGGVFCPVNMDI